MKHISSPLSIHRIFNTLEDEIRKKISQQKLPAPDHEKTDTKSGRPDDDSGINQRFWGGCRPGCGDTYRGHPDSCGGCQWYNGSDLLDTIAGNRRELCIENDPPALDHGNCTRILFVPFLLDEYIPRSCLLGEIRGITGADPNRVHKDCCAGGLGLEKDAAA